MVSLFAGILDVVSRLLNREERHYIGFNKPVPRELHKTLSASDLENFKEILIIGDVHGCYDELVELLDQANANGDNVLKIFVGDLVRKGPKSPEVLDLVRTSSSMLSVRGNHEASVLLNIDLVKNYNYDYENLEQWVKNISEQNFSYLEGLPYTISIPSLNAVVVHAGLLPGVPLEMQGYADMITMKNIVTTDYFWERGLIGAGDTYEGEPWASVWGGPQHVYFGHNAKRMLQTHFRATGLDTGCVYGKRLTGFFISGPRKGVFVDVKAKENYTKRKRR